MLTAAGAWVLVAGRGPIPNQGEDGTMALDSIPDFIKMKALRGWRGTVDGRFLVIEKGQVVMVAKELAVELRTYGKAVMTEEPLTDLDKAAKGAAKESEAAHPAKSAKAEK
jgi:hypothetical protein